MSKYPKPDNWTDEDVKKFDKKLENSLDVFEDLNNLLLERSKKSKNEKK